MDDSAEAPLIAPLDLVRAREDGAPLQLIDVRGPDRVAAGRIDLVPEDRFHNIPGSQLLPRGDLDGLPLAPGARAVVVCGRGHTSRAVVVHLRALGLDAISLAGGMAAYTDVLVERPIEPPPSLDRLAQFDRVSKGALAYLLVSDGEALLVDAPRDPAALLAAARAAGARVTGVADTHVHADFVSGAQALARDLGVPYHLHPADNAYPYDGTPGRLEIAPLADGARIRVGRATVIAHHTPGHTEGSITYTVDDQVALTGDLVFVESVGRPDLAGRAGEWAPSLWASLERARAEWPAELLVLPAHYASARERRPDRTVAAPFGGLLRSNAGLLIRDRGAFLAWASTPAPVPASCPAIKAINAGLTQVTDAEAAELDVGRNECSVIAPARG